ncbi:hypothetical protein HK096_009310 [Nowakowskiella sp. JEL0078]|nr:hypothetical protein HK096_009310 [Nowakowskiella sp. JEL0078]
MTRCKKHKSVDRHQFFVSYRVATAADLALSVVLHLEAQDDLRSSPPGRLATYLDKFCLEEGKNYSEAFINALKGSEVFLAIITEETLQSFEHSGDREDNVIYEWETALKLASQGKIVILPLLFGHYTPEGYLAKFNFNCLHGISLPNKPTLIPGSEKNVKDVITEILSFQAIHYLKVMKTIRSPIFSSIPTILNTLPARTFRLPDISTPAGRCVVMAQVGTKVFGAWARSERPGFSGTFKATKLASKFSVTYHPETTIYVGIYTSKVQANEEFPLLSWAHDGSHWKTQTKNICLDAESDFTGNTVVGSYVSDESEDGKVDVFVFENFLGEFEAVKFGVGTLFKMENADDEDSENLNESELSTLSFLVNGEDSVLYSVHEKTLTWTDSNKQWKKADHKCEAKLTGWWSGYF